ncbi:MAG: hypothetical protein AAF404_11385, partial [Pseudomonadota bacterium]
AIGPTATRKVERWRKPAAGGNRGAAGVPVNGQELTKPVRGALVNLRSRSFRGGPKTHGYLLDGTMNAVVHQNLQMAANYTVEFLIDHLTGKATAPKTVPVEIITRENTEGITFDG